MMEKESAKVPLYILNDTNWPIWKMRTMAYASAHKWEKILDGSINSRSFKQFNLNKFEKSNITNEEDNDIKLEEEAAENYEDEKSKSKDTKIVKVYGLTFDQFDEGNRFLYYRLISTIQESILNEFINTNSGNAYDLWKILLTKFESQSTANVRQ